MFAISEVDQTGLEHLQGERDDLLPWADPYIASLFACGREETADACEAEPSQRF